MNASLEKEIAAGRERLDAHVREIVQWHFDPDTGCEFWLNYARKLDFDPREAIRSYDDLKKLGHFQDEWLRGGPVRKWLPKGLEGQPLCVFETGGSTGVPKTRININDFRVDYEAFGDQLSDEGFPKGSDWLMLGPTGPRRLRLAIEHLAQYRGGMCFFVDLDPRWVNNLVKRQAWQEMDAYKDHVINQAMKIMGAHPNIKCLFTTPKLLDALSQRCPVEKLGFTGIFCGGTEMTAQFNRFVREELAPGIDFVPTYGNTLMGLAVAKPYEPVDNYAIIYYPPLPRAVFEIVNPDNLDETVPYGAIGRVLLTTLTKEFFMPRFAERDEGERAAPCKRFPWDGVSNLGLLSSLKTSVVVGVY
jgi:phenylacetate-coenzyme A ligase PaaK-like adenylate-forming protein